MNTPIISASVDGIAIAPGDEFPSFLNLLTALRISHIRYDNQEFNETMNEILNQAQLNSHNLIQNLKDELRAQVSETPENESFTVSYVIDMSQCLNKEYPVNLWYQSMDCNGNLQVSKLNMAVSMPLKSDVIYRYLMHVDPQVQQLRESLRSAFPDACIVPKMVFESSTDRLRMIIDITYRLPPVDTDNTLIHTILPDTLVLREW